MKVKGLDLIEDEKEIIIFHGWEKMKKATVSHRASFENFSCDEKRES